MQEFSSKAYLDMELLRFTTAGSVDDGKSTLIGRLLYDSKSIFEDQLDAVKKASIQKGSEYINLALITDGLRAEREQGITIDVAYRYFATPKRKFIIADTPGHIQYTRNMVTGASTANVALILIDARNGVTDQTHRHSYIASLLQIPHLIVCINKMDLADYSEEVYETIKTKFMTFTSRLNVKDFLFVPISALKGDNVVDPSANMPWYKGRTLMQMLETIPIDQDHNWTEGRFPVQYVVRPHLEKYHDFRGYAGRVDGGTFKAGDLVTVLPAGINTTIKKIWRFNEEIDVAYPPMSVTIELNDNIDISRGNMIVKDNQLPLSGQDIELMVCWMDEKPLNLNGRYTLRHTTGDLKCVVKEVLYKVNVNNLDEIRDHSPVKLNDIARIRIRTSKPLYYDPYNRNRKTGSLILVDEFSNMTSGACMIL